jgi:D-beta-D-heptose 7-phosphate kinase/D-beta-D-heptose 1-phosphate adenosyltransferase
VRPVSDAGDLVGKLSGAQVLCVGDVMLDRFVYGEVSRVSPEAPVPVCRVVNETAMLGGAGNVARNLAALGASLTFVSVVGTDAAGEEIATQLSEITKGGDGLIIDDTRPSTIKERFIAGSQQLLRVDREVSLPVGDAVAEAVITAALTKLATAGALVISDYGKGVLSDDVIARLIAAAREAGCPVIVDPKGSDYRCYAGATLVTPNRRELQEASRMPTGDDAAVIAAARHIAESCSVENILVTRSADGMTLVSGDDVTHLSADAREVFDVSGAGDTVVAALAASLAAGIALGEAAALANAAAGIVVAKIGTAVAYADDLQDAIAARDPAKSGNGKVMTLAAALDRIAAWRQRGERIGFTNGCFDLIHPGHVSLLAQARAGCDRLVVGLNADQSVRRLKGPERPVQNEVARSAVMASLESVDLVILFPEDTPENLIEAIRPDVLAKGADYTVEQVVGAPFVQSYGGEILLVDLEPGHSTTATIDRIGK